jgi:CRP/FNR family transcriptional regulator
MHVRPIHLQGLPGATLSLPRDAARLPCDRCAGRSLGICAPFSNEALSSLLKTGRERKWDRGELLYRTGDPAEAFYKIKRGIVIEYNVLPSGRRQIVAIRSVGDMCGYPAPGGRHNLTAEAVIPVEACGFAAVKFTAKLERDIEFACAVANDLAQRLERAWVSLTAIGQLTAIERVAYFIVEMEELHRVRRGETSIIEVHLTRQEIGDYLGLSFETISRSFATLKNMGLIAFVGNNAVSVLARERLLQMAKHN